jgi:EAL domain-containing protein (putative c-di-GMP-specific phosphodiesterase class I)
VATLLDLGCVAGQGFLFAKSTSLEVVEKTPFMARRARLRTERAASVDLTATGRYRTADLWPRSAAG